jgi:DNA polymerase III epsilon subunit-like protein
VPLANIVPKKHQKVHPKVGKYYIVQFDVGKCKVQSKHYVGKVLKIARDQTECEMMFARRTARTSAIFSWPTVADLAYVDTKQLKIELSLQKEDRRGKLLFPTSQLTPIM